MGTVSAEVRTSHTFTSREGATVVIAEVPVEVVHDGDGREHRLYSIGVALRLEQLTGEPLERDATPGIVHRLKF